MTKSLLEAPVVEDGEGDRRFPNPPCTDQSDRFEVFSEPNDIFDQLVTSKQALGAGGGDSPTGTP